MIIDQPARPNPACSLISVVFRPVWSFPAKLWAFATFWSLRLIGTCRVEFDHLYSCVKNVTRKPLQPIFKLKFIDGRIIKSENAHNQPHNGIHPSIQTSENPKKAMNEIKETEVGKGSKRIRQQRYYTVEQEGQETNLLVRKD